MGEKKGPLCGDDRPLHPSDRNLLKAARFERPDRVPMIYHVNASCWAHFPQEALVELMAEHPLLFPDFVPPDLPYSPPLAPNARAGEPFTDPWGCVWETSIDGIVGTVTGHPLEDWASFENYTPPDPEKGEGMGEYLPQPDDRGRPHRRLKTGGLRHGHTFQQLCDLRGYVNLTYDMADGEPRLLRLLEMVEDFNLRIVEKALEDGAEWMFYPEDLGMQSGPMISPDHFAAYIQPAYERLMEPARRAGAVVHCHCDGDVRSLAPLLLECPLDVLNIQDLVNGIDWIAENIKGKVAVDLDIDRTEITVHGTPAQIDALIRKEVSTLGSPEGGLTMIYGLYPGTPLPNARAVADAMERYASYWTG